MYDRIFEFVADDVQMIIATDHNVISDYAPFIEELDAGRYITSAVGDELTTNGWGHFGAFPLPHDIERAGEGAVLVHGREPDDFFKDVRRTPPARSSTCTTRASTPRSATSISGSSTPRNDRAGAPVLLGLRRARGDQRLPGPRPAQRRSRRRRLVLAAQPRPPRDGDRQLRHPPPDVQHRRLSAQLRQGPRGPARTDRSEGDRRRDQGAPRFFTTGPFVSLLVNGGTIGDLVPARGGKAHAEVTVQAAPWVVVDRVTLYLVGQEAKRWTVPPGRTPFA